MPATPRAILLGLVVLGACAATASAVLPGLARTKADHALVLAGRGTTGELRRGLGEALYASRLDPLAAQPLVAAAAIHTRAGDPAGAAVLLGRAVERQPDDLGAWQALLAVAIVRNDRVAMRTAAARIVTLDPASAGARVAYQRALDLSAGSANSPAAVGTPLPPATVLSP